MRTPTDPGKEWSDHEMKVIRLKLRKIWENAVEITKLFDPHPEYGNSEGHDYVDYLYDPNKDTTEVDCRPEQIGKGNCGNWWGENRRGMDIAFNERKMLRLAFHDCFKYTDGQGGCDGCLNLEPGENLGENDGLQFSVAVLEALYTDKDFPDLSMIGVDEFENAPELEKSPQELGISRADLWAFAGLVALDEVQSRTRQLCLMDEYGFTCDQTQCFSSFDQKQFEKMFKTGRKDCKPRFPDNPKLGYLAKNLESTPNQFGNGQDSVNYFNKDFKLKPRQSLALLGIHTVGKFNPMTAHTDYAWVRDRGLRQELFNNEYYQMMSLRPSRIKTGFCTGNMSKLASVVSELFLTFLP